RADEPEHHLGRRVADRVAVVLAVDEEAVGVPGVERDRALDPVGLPDDAPAPLVEQAAKVVGRRERGLEAPRADRRVAPEGGRAVGQAEERAREPQAERYEAAAERGACAQRLEETQGAEP